MLQNYLLLLHPMTKFTETEALDEIFNSKELTASQRVNKSRWLSGKLSQKLIDAIIKENGYNCIQEKLYTKS